jgi:hypothetical protein
VLSWRANELRKAHKVFGEKREGKRPIGRHRLVKVKVKFTLLQATKSQRRSRGITLLFL